MKDVRGKLRVFLKDKLASKVLQFFYQNQGSIDSLSGVAAWVHLDKEQVQSVLDDLVDIGVLERDSTTATKGYCYTRDENMMKLIQDLMRDG